MPLLWKLFSSSVTDLYVQFLKEGSETFSRGSEMPSLETVVQWFGWFLKLLHTTIKNIEEMLRRLHTLLGGAKMSVFEPLTEREHADQCDALVKEYSKKEKCFSFHGTFVGPCIFRQSHIVVLHAQVWWCRPGAVLKTSLELL